MLSSISVGKVDAYPLVEPQDIANITSNPFPFIGLFKLRELYALVPNHVFANKVV